MAQRLLREGGAERPAGAKGHGVAKMWSPSVGLSQGPPPCVEFSARRTPYWPAPGGLNEGAQCGLRGVGDCWSRGVAWCMSTL